MRRRRRQEAEAFGTSLADILTTALGCVLLLFMVAVMHIRTTLSREQDARARAAQALALRSADLNAAQAAGDAARGRQQAAEAALAEAPRRRRRRQPPARWRCRIATTPSGRPTPGPPSSTACAPTTSACATPRGWPCPSSTRARPARST
ncbi:MAG: hypothetical protein H6704_25805 [Myxococcales bacterium]|nr:hypothetical protein [Myxococcales bacterium]